MDIQTKLCERKRPDNWLLLAAFPAGEFQSINMVFIGGSFPNPPDISFPRLGPAAKMNFQNKDICFQELFRFSRVRSGESFQHHPCT